jgi:hypothetical protein
MYTMMYGTPTWRASRNVLPRLRHRAVGRAHDEDRPVHLRRAGDHVLDVVRVARAVHVRVVTVRRLVLHVRRVDRDPARLLSGALSIWSYAFASPPNFFESTSVIAAVSVVLPWSTCPIVPTFTCGLLRSNLPFAIVSLRLFLIFSYSNRRLRRDSTHFQPGPK